MHACMHAWNYKITAAGDHAAGTDYTLVKHSNGAGEGRRFLRVAPANLREAGSVDTVQRSSPTRVTTEARLARHNGDQVGKVFEGIN